MIGTKKIIIISVSAIALALVYYFYIASNPELNSETIALINGKPIKLQDFEERLSNIKMNYPPDKVANFSEIKQTILRRMVIEQLVLQDAEEKNIKVTDEELNRYVNSIKQNYSDDEFNQLLLNQFKTYEDWQAEVKQRLIVEKTLSREVIDKINVPDNELREYYDKFYANKTNEPRVKLAQIFTTTKENADKALEELKAGAPFEQVVKKYSEAPEASKNGVVGLIAKGEGIEIFDKAFEMQTGEISTVIQSDYGFHILKVIDHIQPTPVTFEEAKPFILNEIVREKESKYYEEWLGKRFKKSRILKNTALMDSLK